MSINQKLTWSVSSDSPSTPLTGSSNDIGNLRPQLDQSFAASVTDQLFTISFTLASLQSVFLISDKGLKIETNSGSTPGDTINLGPNIPVSWSKSAGYPPCPFTVNVTAFYITTTVAARLQGCILTS